MKATIESDSSFTPAAVDGNGTYPNVAGSNQQRERIKSERKHARGSDLRRILGISRYSPDEVLVKFVWLSVLFFVIATSTSCFVMPGNETPPPGLRLSCQKRS
jgi:hypothetical protein